MRTVEELQAALDKAEAALAAMTKERVLDARERVELRRYLDAAREEIARLKGLLSQAFGGLKG